MPQNFIPTRGGGGRCWCSRVPQRDAVGRRGPPSDGLDVRCGCRPYALLVGAVESARLASMAVPAFGAVARRGGRVTRALVARPRTLWLALPSRQSVSIVHRSPRRPGVGCQAAGAGRENPHLFFDMRSSGKAAPAGASEAVNVRARRVP